jgi:pimeloyl-ACP methyl ester carboxylesterase
MDGGEVRKRIESLATDLRTGERAASAIASDLLAIVVQLRQADLAEKLRLEAQGYGETSVVPGIASATFERRTSLTALEMRLSTHAVGAEKAGDVQAIVRRSEAEQAKKTLKERRAYLLTIAEDMLACPPVESTAPWIMTLHGIRTRGVWQKTLSPYLFGFRHEPLDYDYFDTIRFLLPWSRDKKVDWFRDTYGQSAQKFGGTPSIIAHSFGTYIVTRAIEKYGLRFDRIILCGSIVRMTYPWSEQFKNQRIERVLHDFGARDLWATLVAWVVPDAGPSGAKGYADDAGGRVVQRGNKWLGHSDYFHVQNFTERWLPFLRGVDPPDLQSSAPEINWRFRLVAVLLLALIGFGVWWWLR